MVEEVLRTQTLLHMWRPASQVYVQAPPVQATLAFARCAQGVQLVPHEFTLLFKEHVVGFTAGHACAFALQVRPQTGAAPMQVGVPLTGSAQTAQLLPHEVTLVLVSETQVPAAALPHRWKPAAHVRTHAPAALQVTAPLAGAVHTVQLFPHDVMAVLPLMMQVGFAAVPHW
jgi:hypothetical protein